VRKNDKRGFNTLPTANGGIARAAYARAIKAKLDVRPLLARSSLTVEQAATPNARMPVKNQITFLNLVADALQDQFLGIRLGQDIDLRELGFLYYVLASSENLGDALRRVARYSAIHNEGVHITYSEGKDISVTCNYVGVPRTGDRHQIEFIVTILLRTCRQLVGRHLSPSRIRFVHRRGELPSKLVAFFSCKTHFGSQVDELSFPRPAGRANVTHADPFLNSLLVKYHEEIISTRHRQSSEWRLNVENAIVPLLPHGQAQVAQVARRLGVSRRTLARRLESEGLTFLEILDGLRLDLANRYLRESALPISEVAWLLGYKETSAFDHAFKRWTGQTPKQMRRAAGMEGASLGNL
jgi:AraC-like DNA-binding protein